VQTELFQFAVKRGARNIEVLCGLGNIAVGAHEGPVQRGAFGQGNIVACRARLANQIGRRDRARQRGWTGLR
jgi:hypothetical protein